ncbi:hypothetical protein EOL70_02315 [Leucothrix sargassi]|nr:hypothetical protein EOL70_02315 [Leucothrix sargassi]
MIFDIFQQYRIERSRSEALSKASEASGKAIDNKISIRELQEQIDHLSLVTMAMSELLEEVGFSRQALIKKIEEIDLRDGKLDGKLAATNTCVKCSRVVAPRHSKCIYCGTPIKKDAIL